MSQESELNRFMLIFGLIFFLCGTVFFATAFSIYISDQNFKRSAVQTNGVITDINQYRNYSNTDSSGNYSYDVYVSFTVDGELYEGSINEWDSGMYIGKVITVFYNPDNPWDFRTDSSIILFIFFPMGLLFMLIGAISLIRMFLKKLVRKNLMENGVRVMADITEIIGSNIRFNNRDGIHIICERVDEVTGTICQYKSDAIWSIPASIIEQSNIARLPVYVDSYNENKYYVDTSQLFEDMSALYAENTLVKRKYKIDQAFQLGRYPKNTIMEAFRKADKSEWEITLENEEPWFSIDIDGFDRDDDTFLLDVIAHIEEFDNTVQRFCRDVYRQGNYPVENYMVGLHWIQIESNKITFGYWGECVNIELRAIFINENGNWETVDIHYQ